ncbi:MAG: hypothetical protein ACYDBX_00400 [Patescibacteria group bacterium]
MDNIELLKQGLYSKFCDKYYTRTDLDRDLMRARIDITNDDSINTLLKGGNVSAAVEHVASNPIFKDTVVDGQYKRYLEGVIATNLETMFSRNPSNQYRSKFKNREAMLLARALAPSIALSYLPQQGGPNKGKIMGIDGFKFNFEILYSKKYRDTIESLLYTYYTRGYMPALNAKLDPESVMLPPSQIPKGVVGRVTKGGGVINVDLRQIALEIRNRPRDNAITYISKKYSLGADEARAVYQNVFERSHGVAIITDDYNNPVTVSPVISDKWFALGFYWQSIWDDKYRDNKRRKGRRPLSIPRSWSMGKEIGMMYGLGAFGARADELRGYSSSFLQRVVGDNTYEYLMNLRGTFNKKTLKRVPSTSGPGLLLKNTSPELEGRSLPGRKDVENGYDYNLNEKETGLLKNVGVSQRMRWFRRLRMNVALEYNYGDSLYQRIFKFGRKGQPRSIKETIWRTRQKRKKVRLLKFIDVLLAIPGIAIMLANAAIGATISAVDTRLLGGKIAGTLLGRASSGSVADRLMLSFEGFKFSFNALKLVFKDGIEAAIPGILIGAFSGVPIIGFGAAIVLFGAKFSTDFLSLFSTQNPAVVDILSKITGTMVDAPLSGTELAVSGAEFVGGGFLIGGILFAITGNPLLFGLVAGAGSVKFMSSLTVGRGMDIVEASKLDASFSRVLLYRNQYMAEFGGSGLIIGGLLSLITGSPLVFGLVAGGSLLSGAATDFFKNAILDETTIRSLESASTMSDVIHVVAGFGGGTAIIGGALFGPVGLIGGFALGAVPSTIMAVLRYRMQSIAVGDRVQIDALRNFSVRDLENIRALGDTGGLAAIRGELVKYGFTKRGFQLLGGDAELGRLLVDKVDYLPEFHNGLSYEAYVRERLSSAVNYDLAEKQQWLSRHASEFGGGVKEVDIREAIDGGPEAFHAFLGSSGFDTEMIRNIEGIVYKGVDPKTIDASSLKTDLKADIDKIRYDRFLNDYKLNDSMIGKLYRLAPDRLQSLIRPMNLELRGRLELARVLTHGNAFDFMRPDDLIKYLQGRGVLIGSEEDLAKFFKDELGIRDIRNVPIGDLKTALINHNYGDISEAVLKSHAPYSDALASSGLPVGSIASNLGIDLTKLVGANGLPLEGIGEMRIDELLRRMDLAAEDSGHISFASVEGARFVGISEFARKGVLSSIGKSLDEITGIGSIDKFAALGRLKVMGLPISTYKDILSSGMWGFIAVAAVGLPLPIAVGAGLGIMGGRAILGRLATETGGYWTNVSKLVGDNLNPGLIGFTVGSLIFGPVAGVAIGVGTATLWGVLKSATGKIPFVDNVTGFGTTIMHVGGEVFKVGMSFSLVDQLYHLDSFVPSLLFQNGLMAAINAWSTAIFGTLGFVAAGWAVVAGMAALGILAPIAVPIIVIGAVAVGGIDFFVHFFTGHGVLYWIGRGVGDIIGHFFGSSIAGAIASLGFDMLVGLILLFSRFDFDLDNFLKTIFIMVFSWSLIGGGVFGSGVFSGSSNNNTSNVATNNSAPANGVASNIIISPAQGTIFKIDQSSGVVVSDTVYIKTQSGQVFGVKNVNNPYLYSGETITKGQFIGNVAQ